MAGVRVLVVEDDSDLRLFFTEVLTWAGNSVRVAQHGLHAFEVLDDWRPEIILLDIVMPVMDGLTFLERKREMRDLENIPVVVVSATAESPIEGACCVLRKPVDPVDLVAAVRANTV